MLSIPGAGGLLVVITMMKENRNMHHRSMGQVKLVAPIVARD
jgi:hypothetical protein